MRQMSVIPIIPPLIPPPPFTVQPFWFSPRCGRHYDPLSVWPCLLQVDCWLRITKTQRIEGQWEFKVVNLWTCCKCRCRGTGRMDDSVFTSLKLHFGPKATLVNTFHNTIRTQREVSDCYMKCTQWSLRVATAFVEIQPDKHKTSDFLENVQITLACLPWKDSGLE